MGEAKRKLLADHSDAPYLDTVAPNVATYRSNISNLVFHNSKLYRLWATHLTEKMLPTASFYDLGAFSNLDLVAKFGADVWQGLPGLLEYVPEDNLVLCYTYTIETSDGDRHFPFAAIVMRHNIDDKAYVRVTAVDLSKNKAEMCDFFALFTAGVECAISNMHETNPEPSDKQIGIILGACLPLAALLVGIRDRPIVVRETYSVSAHGRAVTNWVKPEPPVMKVRVVDLSSAIVAYNRLGDRSHRGYGTRQRPHNHPGSVRTYKHAKFVNVQGKTVVIQPYKVHGGVDEPAVTVVKGLPGVTP